jgi:pre-rRNA-processing protein IPI3
VSASEDQSVIVWDYQKGIALRTYLLRAVPRAIVLDRSDRGFYTTYEDGTVQVIDFYTDAQHMDTLHDENITTPVQPGDETLWGAEGQELGEGLSLALNWEGTRLLSGHKSGKIASWDVGKGSFMSIVENLPGTATNIVMAPVQGLLNMSAGTLRLTEIVKPRISSSEAEGVVPGDYALSAQIATKTQSNLVNATHTSVTRRRSQFQTALTQSSFPQSFLDAALAELDGGSTTTSKHINGDTVHNEEDRKQLDTTKAQNEHLQQQVEHLQKLQKASFAQLREKNRALSTLVAEQERLAEIAKAEHGWNIVDANVEWMKYQQRQKGTSEDKHMPDGG